MDDAAIYERLDGIFRETLGNDAIALTPATTAEDVPE
jgi:hypothetical protein